ncbi:MAG: HIT domain-containing protein [Candidatus Marinimicrobia bacterium]|nr:HIT domain-containing protein [Candidatus Neomarinimicrobiota bacterium]MBT6129420.1 HIT domain-containing protein [Candidatus Neomarinimicrobiota bacterium]MBT6867127.1 HIT domain-containing protein [Candidatus Neomarinimicrobiota bacterium]MBT7042565.1 HIT domain-containing protein [Candidatus Neomarinimicrobiota bacterium]MBT7515972.1 HIT domain-containing protein [Candidatus Neomarinimicrobiota bacterium]
MKRLWAPWRMDYIQSPKEDGCIFCLKTESKNDRDNLVLFRGKESFILMNLYPYTNGHLMISPYCHTNETNNLSDSCNLEIMTLANKSMSIMKKTMKAEGFNFGVNIGKAGGAGIEEHLHYHIVPRWSGDTNFMPLIGHTKVMVEGLKETWDNLKPHFDLLKDKIHA